LKTTTPSQLIQVTALTLAIGAFSPWLFSQENAVDENRDEAVAASPWTEADTKLANHYIRLLEKNPEYGNVLDLLWSLYEKKSQTPLLLDYFHSAVSSEDGPSVVVLIHAHLLRKSNDIEAAREAYTRVTDLDPNNIPALLALAEIADLQKRTNKALSLYTRLVEKLSANTENGLTVRLRKANLHQQLGQLDAAINIWRELLTAYPEEASLRTEIVSMLLESGETDTAIHVLTELSNSVEPRQKLNAFTELNRIYEFISNFEGASDSGRDALKLLHFKSPEYGIIFGRLVQLHEQFERLELLDNELTAAATAENPTEKSLHDLAAFYELTADPIKKEQTLRRLVSILPNNIDYRLRLARAQVSIDRFEEAAETLDGVIAESLRPALNLILLRVGVSLNAEEHLEAETILTNYLEANPPNAENLAIVIEFARSNYLDKLVEQLLKSKADKPEAGPPAELARFLNERGRPHQAVEVLNNYITRASEGGSEKKNRLVEVTATLRDLDRSGKALETIEAAIALSPKELSLKETRADILIENNRIEEAIQQLCNVWDQLETLEEKTEVDQRLFSLLRGHFSNGEEAIEDPSILRDGNIQSLAQYRRLAIVANKASRPGDEPPPEELIHFYETVKKTANTTRTLADRYRAAWWAFKLQDNHECYAQLTTAKEEAGGPILKVELMLLSLAELNERTTLMVDHLTTLSEIDPTNANDYLQRRAAMRFELGYEDEAIRELKRLAAQPEAPLTTLSTLAKVYSQQGNFGKQIEVWRQAYRQANSFEKRRIIKQLSTVLIENGRPEEALAAQIDLLEQESDTIQRRKLLDSQLNIARTHFLLDWMLGRFQSLAQQHPFDRFYPEALARVQQTMGDTAGAFASLKKAYYMSENRDGLLSELSSLADELGDLKSAIYYRRQLLSRGEGDQLEDWQTLLSMLEKDLRVDEANLLRGRLENRFGRDPGFLSELAKHYELDGRHADAERVLAKIVQLRDWDLQARFRLALIQSKRGHHSEALSHFLSIIDNTNEVNYPKSFLDFARPLIRVDRLTPEDKKDAGNELRSFVFAIEEFPYLGGSMQDDIAEALIEKHREYQYLPAKPLWLRIRAIEEAASLSALTNQATSWLERWEVSKRPNVEKLWAYRFLKGNREALKRYTQLVEEQPKSDAYIHLFNEVYARILTGNADAILFWINDPSARVGRHDRVACFSMAALILLTDPITGAEVPAEFIFSILEEMPLLDKFGPFLFAQLREKRFYDEAFKVGSLTVESMRSTDASFLFSLSQVAAQTGHVRAQVKALDLTLQAADPGDSIRSRDLFLSALTERLSLMDSDLERQELVNRLLREVNSPEPSAQENKEEKTLLIHIAARRYDKAIQTLAGIVSRQVDFIRPQNPDPDDVRYNQIQSWQELVQLLRYYSARIPLDLRYGAPFVKAISADALALPVDDSGIAQFEHFEIMCETLPMEWVNAQERVAIALNLEGQLVDPDSRFELGKFLETLGFHREAALVYQREVSRRGKSYGPMQGLFEACETALYPAPALDVIHRLSTREYNPPPGLTADYIAEQHARFLAIERNFERLVPLSRKPTGAVGSPPIATESHLPFQRALIGAYQQSGEDDALMRLLTQLRNTGEIESRYLLLGADQLRKNNRPHAALEWLKEIPMMSNEPDLEREAIIRMAELYQLPETKDLDALIQIAHDSHQSQPFSVALALALATHEAGATGEAQSLLSLIRRGTSDRKNRFSTSLSILLTQQQSGTPLENMPNQWEALFHDFDYDDTSVNASGFAESNASHLIGWVVEIAKPSEALAQLLENTPIPEKAKWLQRLFIAWNRNSLESAAGELLAQTNRRERERILHTLTAFGDTGISTAKQFVKTSAFPGSYYFPDDPEQQVLFFHRIGDRPRLLEVHHRLMQEAKSDIFRQTGLSTEFATLISRRQIPTLFHDLGETDLASRLFRRYHDQLTSYRWDHRLFLEDYAAHLIKTRQFEEAETLLHQIFQKSLSIDLRLLMRLYAEWGKLDSWEDRTVDLRLTSGRISLLREWRTALAQGNEMVEYRNSW
tara:strand:+ start:6969 stop:13109 length:6141 start_codon:yes stop_codon:yes gene_type:complete